MNVKKKSRRLIDYDINDKNFWYEYNELIGERLEQSVYQRMIVDNLVSIAKFVGIVSVVMLLPFYNTLLLNYNQEPVTYTLLGILFLVFGWVFYKLAQTSDEDWDLIEENDLLFEKIAIESYENEIDSDYTSAQKLVKIRETTWGQDQYSEIFKLGKAPTSKSIDLDVLWEDSADPTRLFGLYRLLGIKDLLMIKTFDQKQPVSKNQLIKLTKQIEDYVKINDIRRKFFNWIPGKYHLMLYMRYESVEPFVISTSGFTDDAISYIEDDKNWVRLDSYVDEDVQKDIESLAPIILIHERKDQDNIFKLVMSPLLAEFQKDRI